MNDYYTLKDGKWEYNKEMSEWRPHYEPSGAPYGSKLVQLYNSAHNFIGWGVYED